MDHNRRGHSYDDPSGWWGPVWNRPRRRTLVDVIADRTLDVDTAALLWSLLARRSSLVVVAGPSGVGKTILLTALTDLLPASERRVYVRGAYDQLGFLDDPAVDPVRTALMVNEVSPHLPIYLWGPAVRRLLQATERGFRILATAHAQSAQDLVGSLAGYPLHVAPSEIAALEVVVVLHAWRYADAIRRHVVDVTGLERSARGGILLRPLVTQGPAPAVLDVEAAVSWLGEHCGVGEDARGDLRYRAQALNALLAESTADDEDPRPISMRLDAALERSRDGRT